METTTAAPAAGQLEGQNNQTEQQTTNNQKPILNAFERGEQNGYRKAERHFQKKLEALGIGNLDEYEEQIKPYVPSDKKPTLSALQEQLVKERQDAQKKISELEGKFGEIETTGKIKSALSEVGVAYDPDETARAFLQSHRIEEIGDHKVIRKISDGTVVLKTDGGFAALSDAVAQWAKGGQLWRFKGTAGGAGIGNVKMSADELDIARVKAGDQEYIRKNRERINDWLNSQKKR